MAFGRFDVQDLYERLPRWLLVVGVALCVLSLGAASVAWRAAGAASGDSALWNPPASGSGPPVQRVFPVAGNVSYGRTHHGYPATDVLAPCGALVVAVYSGVVLEVNRIDQYNRAVNAGLTRGGLSVSLLGDDGVRYYGSHFSTIEANIQPGTRVAAGEPLGRVGKTGDASACHLHFGLSPVCYREGDWWIRRGVIWPWPYLDSWRSGGNMEPLPEIQQWQAANGCPTTASVEP